VIDPALFNDRVVYLFETGSGLGFEWFAALASTKRDVGLYYEVMVPTWPGLGVPWCGSV
jgi:hypothetical protein